jgi:O-acetyl-ADP-ribose deacetylase (regulator of RNase III)
MVSECASSSEFRMASGGSMPSGARASCAGCGGGEARRRALRCRAAEAMLGLMSVPPGIPTLEEIIADLRVLRERGLVRLRHTDLADLGRAAGRMGPPGDSSSVEALVRAAVDNLGGGSLGASATATFGLARGARDMPAPDRRRRAALVYGVSVERFRKHHERIVLEQVAEEILKICMITAMPRQLPAGRAEFSHQIRLTCQFGSHRFPLVVHIEPVELLAGVDIIVVPENIYLELPQHFKSSVSAAVRRAAATRSADGEIVTDVISDELLSWMHAHGRVGLPVAPGTVAATTSGEMAAQGVRRIYHAAVAAPRSGTNDYDIEPTAIATSVRNALALARAERQLFDPALTSLAFPLLGAGRGGLDPATSFSWLWTSLERDMRDNAPWEIHLLTRRRPIAELIVAKLGEAGVIASGEGDNFD